jgi:hypothetical protein
MVLSSINFNNDFAFALLEKKTSKKVMNNEKITCILFNLFTLTIYSKYEMQLSEFISLIFIYCIPFLIYINVAVQPRRGFSNLFILIIISSIFWKFSFLYLLGCILLVFYSLVKLQNIKTILGIGSFIVFNATFFKTFSDITQIYSVYLVPLVVMVASVFSLMMIGHWYLVDPTINREGMKKIAIFTTGLAILISVTLLTNQRSYGNFNISIFGENNIHYVILGLLLSTAVLSFASYKSLQEKSYTGVMASTGLSYLSLLVALGASGTLLLSN